MLYPAYIAPILLLWLGFSANPGNRLKKGPVARRWPYLVLYDSALLRSSEQRLGGVACARNGMAIPEFLNGRLFSRSC